MRVVNPSLDSELYVTKFVIVYKLWINSWSPAGPQCVTLDQGYFLNWLFSKRCWYDICQKQNGPLGLVVPEYREEDGKTLVTEVGWCIFCPFPEEILQELINDGAQAGIVGSQQGLDPAVQGPGNTETPQIQGDVQVLVLCALVHGFLNKESLWMIQSMI